MDTAHMLNVGQGTNLNYYQNQYLGRPPLHQEEDDEMEEERKSLNPLEDDQEDEDQEELDDQVNEMSFNENTH